MYMYPPVHVCVVALQCHMNVILHSATFASQCFVYHDFMYFLLGKIRPVSSTSRRVLLQTTFQNRAAVDQKVICDERQKAAVVYGAHNLPALTTANN